MAGRAAGGDVGGGGVGCVGSKGRAGRLAPAGGCVLPQSHCARRSGQEVADLHTLLQVGAYKRGRWTEGRRRALRFQSRREHPLLGW